MPAKVVDVEAERIMGGGYIQRADACMNSLANLRKADLGTYNSLFLVPPAPSDWRSSLSSDGFNYWLEESKRYDQKEIGAAVDMICDFSTLAFEPYLCFPWLCMDGDNWDIPFWNAAMCRVPRNARKQAARKYWLMSLFN